MSDTAKNSPFQAVRASIEASLLARAAEDKSFRAALTSNPHAALKQMLGVDPIPAYTIKVVEEQPGEIVLVLPREIAQDELSDDLLDLASGGIMPESMVNDWNNMLEGCRPR